MFAGYTRADWVATSSTKAVAVETAAYALLGYTCLDDLHNASFIVNWLNAQTGFGESYFFSQVDQFVNK